MAIEKEIIINVKQEGLDETIKKVNKLDASLDDLGDANKDLSKSMQGTKQSVLDNGGAMGLLNDATGGLAMTVKDAVEASALFAKESKVGMAVQKAYTAVMGSSTGAMKVFKLALISTGIGAIVIAIGLLIANFDKVKTAVMNLIPGLKSVGEFFGKIIDNVTDFIGVTSDATRALDAMGDAAERTLKKNKEFLETEGDLYDQYTKRKIQANIDYNEKVKEFKDQEGGITAENLEYLKKLRAKANREILQADQDRINAQKKQEEDARPKEEEIKPREAVKGIDGGAIGMAGGVEALEMQKVIGDQMVAQNRATQDQMKIYNEQVRAEDLESERIALEAKKQIRASEIQFGMQFFGLVKDLAGKNKAIQKAGLLATSALSIAEIINNTNVGASKEVATKGIFGLSTSAILYAKMGLSIASVLVATQKGLKGLGGGSVEGGGASGGSSSGGGSAPTAPSFNLVQGTGSNQIAEGLGQQQRPIQAYVVSNNVTTAQSLDRNIIAGASL